jgi:hypothetical protein
LCDCPTPTILLRRRRRPQPCESLLTAELLFRRGNLLLLTGALALALRDFGALYSVDAHLEFVAPVFSATAMKASWDRVKVMGLKLCGGAGWLCGETELVLSACALSGWRKESGLCLVSCFFVVQCESTIFPRRLPMPLFLCPFIHARRKICVCNSPPPPAAHCTPQAALPPPAPRSVLALLSASTWHASNSDHANDVGSGGGDPKDASPFTAASAASASGTLSRIPGNYVRPRIAISLTFLFRQSSKNQNKTVV